jgi:hypothetical protein
MVHKYFFQWNIPADNQFCGRTDDYVTVIAEWRGDFYNDGITPYVSLTPVTHHFADLISVIDWYKAKCDIETIAQSHFADIAKQERIKQAQAVLSVYDNPILNRLETAV